MFILKIFSKLIQVLRAGPSPSQVAGGFTFGMFLGFLPGFNLFSLLIWLTLLLVDVNLSAAILGLMVFSLFSFLLDPLFHQIGFALLVDNQWLQGVWTSMYNLPVLPLSRFNNTVVMGSFVSALILALPVYFFARMGVIHYRQKLEPKVQQLKLIRVVKGSKLYEVYSKIRQLGE